VFFVVDFESPEEKRLIQDSSPWFWGSPKCFIKPWNPSFDPESEKNYSAPIWVKLPNLPLHIWNYSSLQTMSDAIRKFYCRNPNTKDYIKTTFATYAWKWNLAKGFLPKYT